MLIKACLLASRAQFHKAGLGLGLGTGFHKAELGLELVVMLVPGLQLAADLDYMTHLVKKLSDKATIGWNL